MAKTLKNQKLQNGKGEKTPKAKNRKNKKVLTKLNDKYGGREYEREIGQLVVAGCSCCHFCSKRHAKFHKRKAKGYQVIESDNIAMDRMHYSRKQLDNLYGKGSRHDDQEEAKYLFCSELVAIVYKTFGLIPADFVARFCVWVFRVFWFSVIS